MKGDRDDSARWTHRGRQPKREIASARSKVDDRLSRFQVERLNDVIRPLPGVTFALDLV